MKIHLTLKQINQLAEISSRFPEIDLFEIVQDSSSGIGKNTSIKFTLNESLYSIDITDVSIW